MSYSLMARQPTEKIHHALTIRKDPAHLCGLPPMLGPRNGVGHAQRSWHALGVGHHVDEFGQSLGCEGKVMPVGEQSSQQDIGLLVKGVLEDLHRDQKIRVNPVSH